MPPQQQQQQAAAAAGGRYPPTMPATMQSSQPLSHDPSSASNQGQGGMYGPQPASRFPPSSSASRVPAPDSKVASYPQATTPGAAKSSVRLGLQFLKGFIRLNWKIQSRLFKSVRLYGCDFCFQSKPHLSTTSYAPKKDLQFPADSVEATQPLLKRRRRMTYRDIGMSAIPSMSQSINC